MPALAIVRARVFLCKSCLMRVLSPLDWPTGSRSGGPCRICSGHFCKPAHPSRVVAERVAIQPRQRADEPEVQRAASMARLPIPSLSMIVRRRRQSGRKWTSRRWHHPPALVATLQAGGASGPWRAPEVPALRLGAQLLAGSGWVPERLFQPNRVDLRRTA
jgi:hypothetical protein